MSVKQLSVFLENRPGALYGMTGILSQNKIDMRALSVAETRDFGILRIIVDDPYKTATVLKDAGYVYNITPVLGVAIPDVPGGLNKVLQVLTDARINVEYMYAFLGGQDRSRLYDLPGRGQQCRGGGPGLPGHQDPGGSGYPANVKRNSFQEKGQTARQPARGLLFQIRS